MLSRSGDAQSVQHGLYSQTLSSDTSGLETHKLSLSPCSNDAPAHISVHYSPSEDRGSSTKSQHDRAQHS
jgi:hypothetical protein